MCVCVCVCVCVCACVCVCLCACVGGGGVVKNICIPRGPQVGVTQSSTHQRSMGNLWEFILELSFEAQSSVQVLNLVFAGIWNEKD